MEKEGEGEGEGKVWEMASKTFPSFGIGLVLIC